jgi:hypothetical protein
VGLVSDLRQDKGVDELVQPIGEDRASDPQAEMEVFEPSDPQEAIPKDQQGPAIADHRHRARQRTRLILKLVPLH